MSIVQPIDEAVKTDQPWSVRMADSMIARHSPDAAQWHYEHGLLLMAIEWVWRATGDARYWDHVKGTVDLSIAPDGTIRTYNPEEHNLDQINHGRVLFPLYQATGDERYKRAIMLLRQQLASQPRTDSGGFWHKQIYPYQIWLDGVYMAGPFYAQYARTFDEPAGFDDVAHEIILTEQHTRDPKTGLLYHAWDERKQQRWANPETGCSPHFWGRAIGWYAMAIVDVHGLDGSGAPRPRGHPARSNHGRCAGPGYARTGLLGRRPGRQSVPRWLVRVLRERAGASERLQRRGPLHSGVTRNGRRRIRRLRQEVGL